MSDQTESRIGSLENNIDIILHNLKQQAIVNSNLLNSLDQCKKSLAKVDDLHAALKTHIDAANARHDESDKKIDHLNDSYNAQKAAFSAHQAAIISLNDEVATHEATSTQAIADCWNANGAVISKLTEIDGLRKIINANVGDIHSLLSTLMTHTNLIQGVVDSLTDIKKAQESAKIDVQNASLKSANNTTQLSQVEKKLENIYLLLKKVDLSQ